MTSPVLSRAQRFGSTKGSSGQSSSAAARPTSEFQQRSIVYDEEVLGMLESVKVIGEWAFGNINSLDGRESIKVIGNTLKDLIEGNDYNFKGRYVTHKTHGRQLDVVSAAIFVRPDRPSITKFIINNFKGVGPVTAQKFVSSIVDNAQNPSGALEELRQKLVLAPWTIDFSAITNKAELKASSEEESPAINYIYSDLSTKIGSLKIKSTVLKVLASYLFKKHGLAGGMSSSTIQQCWSNFARDPYEPIPNVPNYGFLSADSVGSYVAIPRDSPVRLKALVAYALEVGCQQGGHVYLTESQLLSSLSKLDPLVQVDKCIKYGIENKLIVHDDGFSESRYYTSELYEAETQLAKGLSNLCIESKPLLFENREKVADRIQAAAKAISPEMEKNGLDKSQVDALSGILTSKSRLHTLTAGPGCGKTALMEVLSIILKDKSFVFCGPTGKSAKVLNNRLSKHGRNANTIHSTLMGSCRKDFAYKKSNRLDGDVLVVDETGMSDVEISESIIAAANDGMHIIFLGDVDQLPSIGPGCYLKDLIQIDGADHHTLTTTHRNSGGILDVIQEVKNGDIDCVDRDAVKFSHGLGDASSEFGIIANKYVHATNTHGYANVILLMSMRKGDAETPGWNTTYANARLKEMCNPNGVPIPMTQLSLGDRIIIRENMMVPQILSAKEPEEKKLGKLKSDDKEKETRVVNGDTGTILSSIKCSDGRRIGPLSIRINLDDGRTVDFPGDAVQNIQHSYALTVHSGQGSEYKHVIAVVTPGHSSFINRPMLFTGLSRARSFLDINGEDSVIKRVARTPAPTRNSALVERVQIELDKRKYSPSESKVNQSIQSIPISKIVPDRGASFTDQWRMRS